MSARNPMLCPIHGACSGRRSVADPVAPSVHGRSGQGSILQRVGWWRLHGGPDRSVVSVLSQCVLSQSVLSQSVAVSVCFGFTAISHPVLSMYRTAHRVMCDGLVAILTPNSLFVCFLWRGVIRRAGQGPSDSARTGLNLVLMLTV